MSTVPHNPALAVETPVQRKPSLDFSVTGLVYVSMTLFMLLAAVNSQANLLFGVLGLMIGILLVSAVISRVVLARLQVKRVLPEHAVVGKPIGITYEYTNQKRIWPCLSVLLAEMDGNEAFTKQPKNYLLHAAPGMTVSVPTEVTPKRRGLHRLDRYQISTSFPFGFIKRALNRQYRDSLLIFPAIGKVDSRLLKLCRSAETMGATVRPRRGGMDEFYGVKEFREGENPRWIYWRRSARTGTLVAKEMTQVAPPRLLILLDTFAESRSLEQHAAIERIIAMAGSLASQALEAGMSVGLFAWSDRWLSIAPSRGKRHRRDLLGALARLPLNVQHDTQALLDNGRAAVTAGTTPILFTPRGAPDDQVDNSRLLVVSANSRRAMQWFVFEEEIDFSRCMPAEQQPTISQV